MSSISYHGFATYEGRPCVVIKVDGETPVGELEGGPFSWGKGTDQDKADAVRRAAVLAGGKALACGEGARPKLAGRPMATPEPAVSTGSAAKARPVRLAMIERVSQAAPATKAGKPEKADKPVRQEKAEKPAKAEKIEKDKPAKPERVKVVRDSFSVPKSEHAQLKALREALAKEGRIATKSELLRVGIQLLAKEPLASLKTLVESLSVVPKGKSAK